MRENVTTKGQRYLLEGRLVVTKVVGDDVRATCRGGGTVWNLGHEVNGRRWWCSCPARSTCAHLSALMLVTVAK